MSRAELGARVLRMFSVVLLILTVPIALVSAYVGEWEAFWRFLAFSLCAALGWMLATLRYTVDLHGRILRQQFIVDLTRSANGLLMRCPHCWDPVQAETHNGIPDAIRTHLMVCVKVRAA